jgi:hypothetical protein
MEMSEPLAAALAQALQPLVEALIRDEVRRAGLEWRWATAERAGELLGISAAAVRQRVLRGQLPARRLDGRVYLDVRELDATIDNARYDAGSFKSTKWAERCW